MWPQIAAALGMSQSLNHQVMDFYPADKLKRLVCSSRRHLWESQSLNHQVMDFYITGEIIRENINVREDISRNPLIIRSWISTY